MGRTRRELLIGTGLVAAGGLLIVRERGQFESSSPPPSTVQPPALCTTTSRPGVYWNIAATANLDPGYQYYVDALERSLRRRFAGVRKNYFAGPGQPEISPEVTMAYAAGRRWTYVNGKPNPIPQDGRFLQWTSVAAGLYDDQFTQLFAAVRNDRRWDAANPFHFSFHHEQEVTSEGGGRLAGSPQDFQAAFWRVRALMDAAGAHVGAGGNMLMCWTPDWLQFFRNGDTGWSGYPYDASNCDPYDPVRGRPYDLLGCDVYRRSGASFDAPTMWEPVQRWANMRQVPFFGGEVGIANDSGNASDVVGYLDDLGGMIREWGVGARPGACLALCWTSRRAKGGDYRLDANPTVLAAYRRLAAQPAFRGCVAEV